jgi:hypothetical protein
MADVVPFWTAAGRVTVGAGWTPRGLLGSMPTPPSKPIVLISYAPADEPERPADGEVRWLSLVIAHLRAANEIGALETWTEPLTPDADLDQEAEHRLRVCHVFVPLVSARSLAAGTTLARRIAVVRDRQTRGESVALYPLVLAETPETTLDIEDLRLTGGKLLSGRDAGERDRQMLDAADEIVEIAVDAGAPTAARPTPAPLSPKIPRRRSAPRSIAMGEEPLRDWLMQQVPQVAAAIAARAALRVTPYWGRQAQTSWSLEEAADFLRWIGSVLRGIALARTAARYPGCAAELRATALVAAERAAAAKADAFPLKAAAYAAAVANMGIPDSAFAAPFDDPTPFAAGYAAAAAAADPAVRMEIGFDVSALERLDLRELADLPLWRERPPDWWRTGWRLLKAALPADQDWDVWIDWYEERVLGGSRGEAHELVFARTPQEIWDRGPAAANAWIKAHLSPKPDGASLSSRPRRLPRRA